MDPELKQYLLEEETIFPGIDLHSDERREEPCWIKFDSYFPENPWDDYSEEELTVEPD